MEKTVRKHEIDMLHGSIWNKLPLFALPVAATAILEQLFHASDVAIVGNFSGDAHIVRHIEKAQEKFREKHSKSLCLVF